MFKYIQYTNLLQEDLRLTLSLNPYRIFYFKIQKPVDNQRKSLVVIHVEKSHFRKFTVPITTPVTAKPQQNYQCHSSHVRTLRTCASKNNASLIICSLDVGRLHASYIIYNKSTPLSLLLPNGIPNANICSAYHIAMRHGIL